VRKVVIRPAIRSLRFMRVSAAPRCAHCWQFCPVPRLLAHLSDIPHRGVIPGFYAPRGVIPGLFL